MKSPGRGEVWVVDLGMAAKVRPAVVLSVPPSDTDRALVTVVPHTTSVRGSRFEVATGVAFLSGLSIGQDERHAHTAGTRSAATWGTHQVPDVC